MSRRGGAWRRGRFALLVAVPAWCFAGIILGCVTPGPPTLVGIAEPLDVALLSPAPPQARAERLLMAKVLRFEEHDGAPVFSTWELKRTRILRRQGQGYVGGNLWYDGTFETVVRHRAWVHDVDGGVESVDDVSDTPALGSYYLYSDSRRRHLEIPKVKLGSVVEEESLVRRTRAELWGPGMVFGGRLPSRLEILVVEFPKGWTIESRASVDGAKIEWAPEVTTTPDGGERWTWRQEDIAVRPTASDGSDEGDGVERSRVVQVRLRRAPLRSGLVVDGPADAEGLSRFEDALIGSPAVSPKLQAVAQHILGPNADAMPAGEKAARLYAWTRDNITYCAIAVGLGGWVPHDPLVVEEVRYGDCKDKANLLRGLLAGVGIKSRLVGIFAGGAPRPFGLPVLGSNFNHMILQVDVDGTWVFADPTTRTVPFGDLPSGDKGRLCLPVDPLGASLEVTPSTSSKSDRIVSRWNLRLTDDGRFRGSVTSTLTGSPADNARGDLLFTPASRVPEAVASWLGGRGSLEDVTVNGGAPPLHRMALTTMAAVRSDPTRPATTGAYSAIAANHLLASAAYDVSAERSPGPFDVGGQLGREDQLELHLPTGAQVVRLPSEVMIRSRFLHAVVRWEVENAGEDVVLRLTRELNYTAERVPAEDVVGFREDHQRYLSALEARVVFASPEGS